MPLYEYQCQSCEAIHEILQKISEAPKRKCPACGGKLTKLLSQSSFKLKGTGWYETDFKDKPKKKNKPEKTDKKETKKKAKKE